MSNRILLLLPGAGEQYVQWLSDGDFEGAAQVKIKKDYDSVYETDLTGTTTPTEFGLVASANGKHVDIKNILLAGINGAGVIGTITLEYWNGSGWNRIAPMKIPANGSDNIALSITGHFDTGARDAGEKFFRLTLSSENLDVSVTILAHEED